ncbi:MAG: diguanylate cyclase with sensor, partial [Frankiales bacterium]|nr:diguanylate cyclase with sensor [Frankiales bacterium]
GADAVGALLAQRCDLAGAASRALGYAVAANDTQAIRLEVRTGPAVFAASTRADGTVASSAGELPSLLARHVGAAGLAAVGSCETGNTTPYAVVASAPLRGTDGSDQGAVVVVLPLDDKYAQSLADTAHGDVTLVSGGEIVATSLPGDVAARLVSDADRTLRSHDAVTVGDRLVAGVPSDARRPVSVLVSSTPAGRSLPLVPLLLLIVVSAGLVATLAARQLARLVTKPLTDLSEAAGRVAEGDLDTFIPERSGDEIGRVAGAFNEMTVELRRHIRALETSRDELRRNLARLGETLSSTHDLTRILTVILETAMVSVRAESGSILFVSSGRNELHSKVTRGFDAQSSASHNVKFGDGVAGTVAATGDARWGIVGKGPGELQLADGEPGVRAVISVPFKSSGRVIGVLNLYDRLDGVQFDEGDVATIRTFAAQASAAIDNVLLHQEAQRLSITDGLTGLWNYRYLQMNLAKEIERATRFRRPLALLVLDLDLFKQVNDVHGHQRGDSVLIEVAQRVKGEIREVDTLARYGGEEFVLVLPETKLGGARQAAQRICDVVRHRPFGGEGEEPITVTVSVGVAVFPDHGNSAATILRRADEALYAAKHAGRDTWRIAASDLERGAADVDVVTPGPTP